jgi:hypothetical protein
MPGAHLFEDRRHLLGDHGHDFGAAELARSQTCLEIGLIGEDEPEPEAQERIREVPVAPAIARRIREGDAVDDGKRTTLAEAADGFGIDLEAL